MSLPWVGGAIRGRALARRRLGDEGLRTLAARRSLGEALQFLSASSYGHGIRGELDLPGAQRAVAETAIWHLRVLAGWLPRRGVELVRAVAGWFELANIEGRSTALATGGRWGEAPFTLGALATVWPKAGVATTLSEVRAVLGHSEWGSPAGEGLGDVFLGLKIGWTRQLGRLLRQARTWANGGLALAVAKARFVTSAAGQSVTLPAIPELGSRWKGATRLPDFVGGLPASARWVMAGVSGPADLWSAERSWWLRVDADATSLLGQPGLGRTTVVAAATVLLTDCWRTQAALEQAARGSASASENS